MNKELKLGIRFAETRLSDLILQNEVNVLEFDDYGKSFIVDMKLSPDAFVQVEITVAPLGHTRRMYADLVMLLFLDGFPSRLL